MGRIPLLAILALAAAPLKAAGNGPRAAVEVLDEAGEPVPGAVVFVYQEKPGDFQPPAEPYVMDQVGKEFVPRLLPVLAGGRVVFPNKDDIHHHVYSFSDAKRFELPLYKGETAAPVTFEKPGVVKLGCNIHDWMVGVILVLPNPYFATTGPDGKAELALPEGGKAELAVFHDRMRGPVDETRRAVAPDKKGAAVSWRLKLKKERRKRPAVESY